MMMMMMMQNMGARNVGLVDGASAIQCTNTVNNSMNSPVINNQQEEGKEEELTNSHNTK